MTDNVNVITICYEYDNTVLLIRSFFNKAG